MATELLAPEERGEEGWGARAPHPIVQIVAPPRLAKSSPMPKQHSTPRSARIGWLLHVIERRRDESDEFRSTWQTPPLPADTCALHGSRSAWRRGGVPAGVLYSDGVDCINSIGSTAPPCTCARAQHVCHIHGLS